MSTAEDIQKLIINHTRRLQKLEERQALEGISVDPAVSIEIEDIRTKIDSLKTELQAVKSETVVFGELDYHYNRALELVSSEFLNHRYELVEIIGISYYGQVWRAHDRILDHPYAILISPTVDEQYARMFLAEARLITRLMHPHVIRIYDCNKIIINNKVSICIVMDFAERGSLENLIRSRRPTTQETIRIFEQICSAVEYFHAQGIIHRNLRSSNILFDRHGEVLISGLGMNMGRIDLQVITPG
jgi:hypothetical protein